MPWVEMITVVEKCTFRHVLYYRANGDFVQVRNPCLFLRKCGGKIGTFQRRITMADATKVYHVSKRAEDDKWQVKLRNGKVIKLFKTKAEAEEYAKKLGANQEGTVLIHASKGASKGRITDAKKHKK